MRFAHTRSPVVYKLFAVEMKIRNYILFYFRADYALRFASMNGLEDKFTPHTEFINGPIRDQVK